MKRRIAPVGSDLMRRLAFIELMELLEFSVLRLDSPAYGARASRDAGLIGTLDWWFPDPQPPQDAHAQSLEGHTVYIFSTAAALRDAVLPSDDTVVHFDSPADVCAPGPDGETSGIRMVAKTRGKSVAAPRPQAGRPPFLRVDVNTLLRRVVVPRGLPQHLFDVVSSLVRSRVWVDVVRP
ncbi:hypothetical protein [Achromobacter pestifer]